MALSCRSDGGLGLLPLDITRKGDAIGFELGDGVGVHAGVDDAGRDRWHGARIGRPGHAARGGVIVAGLAAGGIELGREDIDIAVGEEGVHQSFCVGDAERRRVADGHQQLEALGLGGGERLLEGSFQAGIALLDICAIQIASNISMRWRQQMRAISHG